MLSTLQLYYLQQLGVTPWLEKKRVLTSQVKYFVITPKLNNKERSLLNNIISFAGYKEQKLNHIELESGKLNEQFFTSAPACIISFGLPIEPIVYPIDLRHVLVAPLLTDLLKNTSYKKNLFMQLTTLLEHVS